jgi:hypothetical protein
MHREQAKEEEHVEAEEVVLGDNEGASAGRHGACAEELLVAENVTLRAGMNRVRLAGRVGGGGGDYSLKIDRLEVKYGGLVLIARLAHVYSHYVVRVVGEEPAVRAAVVACGRVARGLGCLLRATITRPHAPHNLSSARKAQMRRHGMQNTRSEGEEEEDEGGSVGGKREPACDGTYRMRLTVPPSTSLASKCLIHSRGIECGGGWTGGGTLPLSLPLSSPLSSPPSPKHPLSSAPNLSSAPSPSPSAQLGEGRGGDNRQLRQLPMRKPFGVRGEGEIGQVVETVEGERGGLVDCTSAAWLCLPVVTRGHVRGGDVRGTQVDESGMPLATDVDTEYHVSFLLTAPQDGGRAGREEVEVVMEVEWVSSGDGRRVAARSSCLVEVCDAMEVREEVRYRCKCWQASAVVSLLLQWTPASILGQVL